MSLHPAFPIVEGNYRLTREWTIDLPGKFNRRIEDDDLVIWRPGLTFWIAIWGLEAGKTPEETSRGFSKMRLRIARTRRFVAMDSFG